MAGRRGDAGEAGGLLGDHHDAGVGAVGGRVDLLQEPDRLEVLPPAVDVRLPLALVARVVQVQDRGHGVHAQAVGVELLEPVQRVRDEEVAHLVAAVVEDQGAPVLMLAAPRIRVLVERLAVEAGQSERVLREVPRHPVDDDADAGLVQPVDQVAQVVRLAEAVRGGVVAADLVAPGSAERVLGDRHELDVREAGLGDVPDQLVRDLAVAEARPPRAQVQLVDAQRLRDGVRRGAAGHPGAVAPGVLGPGHDGCGGRRRLGELRHRIRLEDPVPVRGEDLVLVVRADVDARAGTAPRSRWSPSSAWRRGGRPSRCGRRPRGRPWRCGAHTANAVPRSPSMVAGMRAEHLPEPLVPALADQMQVELADGGEVPVGVRRSPSRGASA